MRDDARILPSFLAYVTWHEVVSVPWAYALFWKLECHQLHRVKRWSWWGIPGVYVFKIFFSRPRTRRFDEGEKQAERERETNLDSLRFNVWGQLIRRFSFLVTKFTPKMIIRQLRGFDEAFRDLDANFQSFGDIIKAVCLLEVSDCTNFFSVILLYIKFTLREHFLRKQFLLRKKRERRNSKNINICWHFQLVFCTTNNISSLWILSESNCGTLTYSHAFPTWHSTKWPQSSQCSHGTKCWNVSGASHYGSQVYQRKLEFV